MVEECGLDIADFPEHAVKGYTVTDNPLLLLPGQYYVKDRNVYVKATVRSNAHGKYLIFMCPFCGTEDKRVHHTYDYVSGRICLGRPLCQDSYGLSFGIKDFVMNY